MNGEQAGGLPTQPPELLPFGLLLRADGYTLAQRVGVLQPVHPPPPRCAITGA